MRKQIFIFPKLFHQGMLDVTEYILTQCSIYTRLSKLILEVSSFLKYLNAMIVGVGYNNVLIHAEAETMW